jgi:PST family polysaccharide transporter
MSIAKKIFIGTAWTVIGQIARQVISLVVVAILARLLSPGDFGLVAMGYTVKALAYVFASVGMGSAIIQRKELDEDHLSTAYWSSFMAGILMTAVVAGSSPFVSWFFNRPELTWIIAVTAITFTFGGISSTHRDLLERKMKFKHISIIDFCDTLAGSAVAVIMAMKGMGYWSLVAREIAGAFFKIPLYCFASGWRPRLIFKIHCFKNLFGFSSYVLLSNFLNYFNRNADNIIIGKVLGATLLGYYDLAYNFMLKPLQYVSFTTAKALFPALSRIQEDKDGVRIIYLRTVKIISLLTFPMMAGLFVVAPETILVIYGPKWATTVPVLQIFCLVGALQSILTTVGTVYMSQGKSALMFKMNLIISPFVWFSFIIGVRWGIIGVAICYAIVTCCWTLINHSVANRLISLNLNEFLGVFKRPLIYTVIMAATVTICKSFMGYLLKVDLVTTLLSLVSCGILAYLIILMRSADDDVVMIRRFVIQKGMGYIMPVLKFGKQ